MTRLEQTAQRFAERYRVAPAEVSRRIELAVIGGDWGANGYTTRAQADLATPVAASARALPFARPAFDAIVHTDVLC